MLQFSFLVGLVLLALFYFCDIQCEPRLETLEENFNQRPMNRSKLVPNVLILRNNNLGDQCSSNVTILPPAFPSRCCGLDVAADSMSNEHSFNLNWLNNETPPESEDITIANRITHGKVTDLNQFPWAVRIVTIFECDDYNISSYYCGGSLISSVYVLTAAHCVKRKSGKLTSLEVYLAEYDKWRFPRDCINSPEGRKCIDNVRMETEDIVIHPDYNSTRLLNDIALIRLSENVPYTEFIRPICLPPINIDNPEFSNLMLILVGWGRNGTVSSRVKQSTVLNLVSQQICSNHYYTHLTKQHLCAMGRSGEDSCVGDSGGPLMLIYKGQSFISGIVSGKRKDVACGGAIPSLFTNVYHYIDWIMENIRN